MTKVFANLKKAVDKLHFRGHRGAYCHEHCDPNRIKELNGVNTPVCEQTFSWMNKYRNCRNMNEARFLFFFLYLIDLRNLDKEKKVKHHPCFALIVYCVFLAPLAGRSKESWKKIFYTGYGANNFGGSWRSSGSNPYGSQR